jgi:PadR family transcriptional regulator
MNVFIKMSRPQASGLRPQVAGSEVAGSEVDQTSATPRASKEDMPRPNSDRWRGTLEMLVLRTLAAGPQHGYGIALRLEQLSNAVLQVEEGSLYPALYRMEQRGWIKSTWGTTDNNRRARFYTLTRAGARHLDAEAENWEALTAAVRAVFSGS